MVKIFLIFYIMCETMTFAKTSCDDVLIIDHCDGFWNPDFMPYPIPPPGDGPSGYPEPKLT
jgi:hypothetical protein